jgi:hypothetical protein
MALVAFGTVGRDGEPAPPTTADVSTTTARPTTTLPAPTALLAAVGGRPLGWDEFRRADRKFVKDAAPSGQTYRTGGEAVIRENRFVRGDPKAFGPTGTAIIYLPVGLVPTTIAAEYVFTAGTTEKADAVVGSAAVAFKYSSIQFAVTPHTWKIFWTKSGPTRTAIETIEEGRIAPPLLEDGATPYRTILAFDRSSSSVLARWGNGQSKRIVHPTIAEYWGQVFTVQVRRPSATDGDVQFLSTAATD